MSVEYVFNSRPYTVKTIAQSDNRYAITVVEFQGPNGSYDGHLDRLSFQALEFGRKLRMTERFTEEELREIQNFVSQCFFEEFEERESDSW